MPIVDTRQFKNLKPIKIKRSKRPFFAFLFIAAIGAAFFTFTSRADAPTPLQQAEIDQQTNSELPKPKTKLKKFAGDEFKKLYSSYAYPNTQPVVDPPEITGNANADAKIRELALGRGYKLNSVPVSSILPIDDMDPEGYLLQPNALIAWKELSAAFEAENIPLEITSAYRSIEMQRELFLERLYGSGATIGSINSGISDGEITFVLSRAAIPGYSRHHTGYVIDFACDGIGLEAFTETVCFEWLSKNNYENVKKFGFVPSYPEEAAMQGPEPEAWEYVWVGKDVLYE